MFVKQLILNNLIYSIQEETKFNHFKIDIDNNKLSSNYKYMDFNIPIDLNSTFLIDLENISVLPLLNNKLDLKKTYSNIEKFKNKYYKYLLDKPLTKKKKNSNKNNKQLSFKF